MTPEEIVALRSITLEPPSQKYNNIMLIGEAPRKDEEMHGLPFAGQVGKLLDSIMDEAVLLRASCVITNVFHIRPPHDKVDYFFGPKEEGADPKLVGYPFKGNMRLKAEYGVELQRLLGELKKWKPKVIVTLGGTALWAITGEQKISDHIGKAIPVQSHIVLPSWHPEFLLHSHAKSYRDQAVDVLKRAKEFADVE